MALPKSWWEHPVNFNWGRQGAGRVLLALLLAIAVQALRITLFVIYFEHGQYQGLIALVFWGALQLLFSIPLGAVLHWAGQRSMAMTCYIWGGICLLLWGGCWGVVGMGKLF